MFFLGPKEKLTSMSILAPRTKKKHVHTSTHPHTHTHTNKKLISPPPPAHTPQVVDLDVDDVSGAPVEAQRRAQVAPRGRHGHVRRGNAVPGPPFRWVHRPLPARVGLRPDAPLCPTPDEALGAIDLIFIYLFSGGGVGCLRLCLCLLREKGGLGWHEEHTVP